jgi:hypothetical protein
MLSPCLIALDQSADGAGEEAKALAAAATRGNA